MAVTIVSTTQSSQEIAEALANPRYGMEVTPDPATPPVTPEPTSEQPPSETPAAEPPVVAEPVVASEPAKDPQEHEEEHGEELTDEDRKIVIPRGLQKKIDRLTRQKYQERGKREASDARIADLERQLADKAKPVEPQAAAPEPAAPVAEVKPVVPEPKPKPKVEDYPDAYEDFIEAMAKYHAADAVAAATAEANAKIADLEAKLAKADTVKEEQVLANEVWNAKVEKAKATGIADIVEVMNDATAGELQITPIMSDAITDHDDGPQIAYYLRKNPEECKRIFEATKLTDKSSQTEIRRAIQTVGREIAAIEAKLPSLVAPAAPAAAPPAPEPPKPAPVPVTSAPAPIRPGGTKTATSTTADPPSNPTEYLKWRENQLKARAG